MLISYSFSNFHSFRGKAEVDFRMSKKVQMTDLMTTTETGLDISKVMAVVGPNGSGKTTLLKAPSFLAWFIADSFSADPEGDIPVFPHFLTKNRPSEFCALFEFDGRIFRYELTCTRSRVLREALYEKNSRFGYVFERLWNADDNSYSVKQKNLGFASEEAKKVRSNASLLSTAAQYGVPLAESFRNRIRTAVAYNVTFSGKVHHGENTLQIAADYFAANKSESLQMSKLLSSWDLGLVGIRIRQIQNETENGKSNIWIAEGQHQVGKKEIVLPFYLESSGTQSAFVLLSRITFALKSGGLAIIDEFESDLHPFMLDPIIDLFANPETNPYGAQLLFSTHALQVLSILNKAQITLVAKDEKLNSECIRLDNVEGIRNDDNHYAKYMAGIYGAVPNF